MDLLKYFSRNEKNELEPKIKDGKIFAILKDKWLEAKAKEIARQKFIAKLIDEYGYVPEQMAQEMKVNNSKKENGNTQADIVIWKTKEDKLNNNSPFLVIECKEPNVKLKLEDCYKGMYYATWTRAKIFAIYNENEFYAYKIDNKKNPIFINSFKPINDIPKANEILDENKLKNFMKKTKEFKSNEFANLLQRCHNLIRNNDKLSPEAAFDEISKILFIKIMYERKPKQEAIFSLKYFLKLKKTWEQMKEINDKKESYMQKLFEEVKKEFKNDGIFDENEKIILKENTFEAILKELEIYNLTKTDEDIKGIAFEKFLSKTFRGQLGQFFTPRTIVNFMIEFLNPKEDELICDPCVGSGGFIISAFEKIKNKIKEEYRQLKLEKQKEIFKNNEFNDEDKQKKYEELLKKFNKEEEERLKKLACSIYGVDANSRMVKVAKINMIMHGGGHSGIYHHDGLLNINGIFRNRFDIIITNPPFGINYNNDIPKVQEDDKFHNERLIEEYKRKYGNIYENELKQVIDNIGKPIRSLFEVGKYTGKSGKSEVLFIERCLDLLKPGGRMGIVLPEGVLNSNDLKKARNFFEGKAKIKLIVSLPDKVFLSAGANVKTSLVFLQKFTEEEKKQFETIKEECIKDIKKELNISILEDELNIIKEKLKNRKEKKEIKEQLKKRRREIEKELKELYEKLEEKVMPCIREKFDYEILVADIKNAGITSTGEQTDNELLDLIKELKNLRIYD